MEKEIIVSNLETNIERLLKGLNKVAEKVSENKKVEVQDQTEILSALKELKQEPVNLRELEDLLTLVADRVLLLDKKGKTVSLKETQELLTKINEVKESITAAVSSLDLVVNVDLTKTERLLESLQRALLAIQFPSVLKIDKDQFSALMTALITLDFTDRVDKMVDLLQEIRNVTGGGGTEVVALKSKLNEKINPATENKQDDIISAINGIEVSSSEWVSALGDDLADDDYYYSGYIKVGTFNWRIVRQSKADFSIAWASGTAEDDTALASVWTNRATQTYNLNL